MIMAQTQTRTADTITERGYFVFVGILPIYVRPLTFGQVVEIGELASMLEDYDAETDTKNMAKYVIEHTADVELLQEIAIIALFRSKIKRRLFGWYIRRHMNTRNYKKAFKAIYGTFDYAFFFTSSLFLKEIKKTVGMKSDTETPHGGSWVVP